MDEDKSSTIRCPHCKRDNAVTFPRDECQHCSKSLAGFIYERATISIVSIVITGAFGYGAHGLVNKSNRYPVRHEYSIIEACAKSSRGFLYRSELDSKIDICIESLEKTQRKFSFEEYKKDPQGFITQFRKNAINY